MAPAQAVQTGQQGNSSLDKALLNTDEKTRLAALYLREQLEPQRAFDNALEILKAGEESSRKIKGAYVNTLLRLADNSNISRVINVVETMLQRDEDQKLLIDVIRKADSNISDEVLSRIKLLIQNPALIKLQDGAEQVSKNIRKRLTRRLKEIPLIRELFSSIRSSIPAYRTYLEIMGRRQEFTQDKNGNLLSDEPTYKSVRRIAPLLTALLKDPQNQRLFRLIAGEHIDRIRESYWERLRKGENVYQNEVIIGAGPTCTNYRSTRAALAPNDTILAIDGRPLPGGQFADVDNPVFRLNSRNRPEGRLTREALPGTESPLNTLGPYATLQAADISSDLYGTQRDFGLVILVNQLLSGDTLCSTRVLRVEKNTTEQKGRYEVTIRNTLTGEEGSIYTDRVVSARGIGTPSVAVDTENDIQTKLLLETSREQPTVSPFGQYITAAEFTRILGDTTNPFPLRGIEKIVIIGGGDSANTSIEAALGLGPTIGLGSSTLDRVEEIVWVGQSIQTKEEWDRCNRDRYVQIGLEFPREGNKQAPYRIQPIEGRAKFLRLNENRELELMLNNNEKVNGQLYIDCSGYKKFDVMDLLGESINTIEVVADELGRDQKQVYSFGRERISTPLRDGLKFTVEAGEAKANFEVSAQIQEKQTLYFLTLRRYDGQSVAINSVTQSAEDQRVLTLDNILSFDMSPRPIDKVAIRSESTESAKVSLKSLFQEGATITVAPSNPKESNFTLPPFTFEPGMRTVPVRNGLKFIAEIDGYSAEFEIRAQRPSSDTIDYALVFKFENEKSSTVIADLTVPSSQTVDLAVFIKKRVNTGYNRVLSLRNNSGDRRNISCETLDELFIPRETTIRVLNPPVTKNASSLERQRSFRFGFDIDTTPIRDGLKFEAEIDGYSTIFEIKDRTRLDIRDDFNTYSLEAEDRDAESSIDSLDIINDGQPRYLPSFIANVLRSPVRINKKILVTDKRGDSRFLTYDELFVSGDTRISVLGKSPASDNALSPDLQKGFRLGVDPCIIPPRNGLRFQAKTDDYQASFTVGVIEIARVGRTDEGRGVNQFIECIVYEGQETDPSKVIYRKRYDTTLNPSISLEQVLRQIEPSTQIEAMTLDESPTKTKSIRFDQLVFNGATKIDVDSDSTEILDKGEVQSQISNTRIFSLDRDDVPITIRDGLEFKVNGPNSSAKVRLKLIREDPSSNSYDYELQLIQTDGKTFDMNTVITDSTGSSSLKEIFGTIRTEKRETPVNVIDYIFGEKIVTLETLLVPGVTSISVPEQALAKEETATTRSSREYIYGVGTEEIELRDGLEFKLENADTIAYLQMERTLENDTTGECEYTLKARGANGVIVQIATINSVRGQTVPIDTVFTLYSSVKNLIISANNKNGVGTTSRKLEDVLIPKSTKITVLDNGRDKTETVQRQLVEAAEIPMPSMPNRVARDLRLEDIQGVVNGDEIVLAKKVSDEEIYVLGPESQVPLSDEEREKSGINTISPNLVAVFLYSSRATGFGEIAPELFDGDEQTSSQLKKTKYTLPTKKGESIVLTLGPILSPEETPLPYDLENERALKIFLQWAFRDLSIIVPDSINKEDTTNEIQIRFSQRNGELDISFENMSIGREALDLLQLLQEKITTSKTFTALSQFFVRRPWLNDEERESTIVRVPLTIFPAESTPLKGQLNWQDATLSREKKDPS